MMMNILVYITFLYFILFAKKSSENDILELKSKNIFNISLYRKGGEGSGTPLQYSCLENPMDRGAW